MRTLLAVAAALAICSTAHAQRRLGGSSSGCTSAGCPTAGNPFAYLPTQSVTFPAPGAAPAGRVVGDGHTHTCPRCGTTWDHSTNPGHQCPKCGTSQFVQDPVRRAVTTVTPAPAQAPKVVPVAAPKGKTGSCDCGTVCPCSLTVRERVPAGLVVTFTP